MPKTTKMIEVREFDGTSVVIAIGKEEIKVDVLTPESRLNEIFAVLKLAADAISGISNVRNILNDEVNAKLARSRALRGQQQDEPQYN